MNRTYFYLLTLLLLLIPIESMAWWNEDWGYRKQLTVDTSPVGANIAGNVEELPVLVRLHTGNFGYFLDMLADGADIRFTASDDKTPLKYHIEKIDPINEMALIWVKVPLVTGNANSEKIWMYYGNPSANPGQDIGGSFDVHEALVYHFNVDSAPADVTAYANSPKIFSAKFNPASVIGAGAKFDGNSMITLPASPSLQLNPAKGWTFSTWFKIEKTQSDAVIFQHKEGDVALTIGLEGTSLYARHFAPGGVTYETPQSVVVKEAQWHYVALVVENGKFSLYLDGDNVASVAAVLPSMQGALSIGSDVLGKRGFVGEIDEVRMSNIARAPDWLKLNRENQGIDSKFLTYGEDESLGGGSGTSYMATVLHNVSIDGWVVIGLLALMAAVSWAVILGKGFLLHRIQKDNTAFMQEFRKLGADDPIALDREDTQEERELAGSPFAMAMFGQHDHFQSSSLYHLYHSGMHELKVRVGKSVGARASSLSQQSVDAIRATLDASVVRETQKLNSHIVLLTIAISGGPFLGLMGTVIGVMITFAAIAASGDVNINAIAPGVSAALATTVAGLLVAIPALFAYNYLMTQIRNIQADMRVFIDELVTRIGEHYA